MQRTRTLIAAAAAATFLSTLPAQAANEREDLHFDHFVAMCDADKDGKVSKAEVMKTIEKMFDKHDTQRSGKLDRKQVEFFLRELMKQGG